MRVSTKVLFTNELMVYSLPTSMCRHVFVLSLASSILSLYHELFTSCIGFLSDHRWNEDMRIFDY